MKKVIYIIFAISLSHNFANCQWVQQNSGTTQHLYDLNFINIQTGWVCGNNGTLLKTTNGGNKWFEQNTGIIDRPLNSIHFINENTGWGCTSLINTAGIIMKTTNGGNNWILQYSSPNKSFLSLFFVDSLKGWISASGSGGWVYRTNDNGNSWDSIFVTTGAARDIEFINSQTGWVTMGSRIYKTVDGGTSWSLQFDNIGNGEMQSLSIVNSDIGYAVSLETWRVYKTTNSGGNWLSNNILPDCFNSHSIYFLNENTGWVSGDCGQLFSTTNGGVNWYQHQTNTNSFLQSVQFVSDSIGWAVGGAGRIINTTTGGAILGIEPISNTIPNEYKLYQNYPNPFNSKTVFRFSLAEADDYRLEVYDLLGKRVNVVFNEFLSAGSYEIKYDAYSLSSGLYLYKLISKKFIQTKKFILIK